jgi:hypothetical protein
LKNSFSEITFQETNIAWTNSKKKLTLNQILKNRSSIKNSPKIWNLKQREGRRKIFVNGIQCKLIPILEWFHLGYINLNFYNKKIKLGFYIEFFFYLICVWEVQRVVWMYFLARFSKFLSKSVFVFVVVSYFKKNKKNFKLILKIKFKK